MNRELWKSSFDEFFFYTGCPYGPDWPCPSCKDGKFRILQDTLKQEETKESKKLHLRPNWEACWLEGQFSCWLCCDRCNENAVMVGHINAEEMMMNQSLLDDDVSANAGIEIIRQYTPKMIIPAPAIIDLPADIPDEVRRELEKSFEIFWIDAASCANRIRSSVEVLLTQQRVKKYIFSNGKRRLLSLHQRIELFKQKRSDLADALMAIKWIGNAGSHSDSIHRNDVLDGYEIMEDVLEKLFARKHERIQHLKTTINKRRKPRSSNFANPEVMDFKVKK